MRPRNVVATILVATSVWIHAVHADSPQKTEKAGKAASAKSVLPFIADDYPKALAEARAKKLPLFVETWAPWCHSCRSMKAFVFTDPALASEAGKFVWLELDTEKAVNAPAVKQLGVKGLPTMFIVDPTTEKVALRWLGGATVPQFRKILDDGALAVASAGGAKLVPSKNAEADAALARADQLFGAGDEAGAAVAFQEALQKAPADWPQYARTIESLLYALSDSDQCATAADIAVAAFPKLAKTPSAANVAAIGLDCAVRLPADDPKREKLMAQLEADARAVVEDPKSPALADDRSGVYIALVDAREAVHDSVGMRDVATRWASFLETEAARAKDPDGRAVFDSHRLSAYLQLEQPDRAIPMLEASERDLPGDYNPAARLAVTYKAMKRWDDALAASDRALAKAYGPRQLGILQTRADIYVGRGDTAAARSTLEKAVSLAEAMPPGQRSERQIASLKKKLDALSKS